MSVIYSAAASLVLFAVFAVVGRRQRAQAGASVAMLLAVAAVLAAGVCAPLFLASLLPVNLWVALFASYFAAVIVVKSLLPVGRLFARGIDLPAADDPELLGRVAELARRLGIRPPQVRMFGSVTPSLLTNAAAGGLVGPTLVVADGILHRLGRDERDAVLAHELGHVRRRTVWIYVTLILVAQVVGVLASLSTAPVVAGMLCVVLAMGLVKIAGHVEEPAADRAGARAVGHATMASALDKLHAALSAHSGFWGALVHATQTHPSRAVRLAALRAGAPEGERAAIAVSAREARWHERAGAAVLVLWFAIVLGAAAAGSRPALVGWAVAALALVLAFPLSLLLALQGRDLVQYHRLGFLRLPWRLLLPRLGLVVLAAGVFFAIRPLAALGVSPFVSLAVFAVLLFAAVLPWPSRVRRGLRRIRAAIGERDFAAALAGYDALPARARRRPLLRRGHAELLAMAGDRQGAIATLQALVDERLRDLAARVSLAVLLGPIDAAAALTHVETVEQRVPGTHMVQAIRAALLRRLGRLDEARDVLSAALAQKPRHGLYHAADARIAVTAGDLEAADETLRRAEALSPGDAFMALVRAELEHARGDTAAARAALRLAEEAARRQPMMFLDVDVAQLRQRVDAMAAGPTAP